MPRHVKKSEKACPVTLARGAKDDYFAPSKGALICPPRSKDVSIQKNIPIYRRQPFGDVHLIAGPQSLRRAAVPRSLRSRLSVVDDFLPNLGFWWRLHFIGALARHGEVVDGGQSHRSGNTRSEWPRIGADGAPFGARRRLD